MSSISESPEPGRLAAFGWSPAVASAFEPFRADGLEPARVAVAFGATFRVIAHDGEMLADLTGRLRHQAEGRRDLPAVGDWIALKRSTMKAAVRSIQGILPRTERVLAQGRGRDHDRADRRGQRGRRVPDDVARSRFQPAPDRALPRHDLAERRAPRDPVEQGRRGRGAGRQGAGDGRLRHRRARARDQRARRPRAWRRCRRISPRVRRLRCSARPASASPR